MPPRKVSGASTTQKRKSDASDAPLSTAKRARSEHANAVLFIDGILQNPEAFELPKSELETRRRFLELTNYVRSLREELEESAKEGPVDQSIKKMSPEEVAAAVNALRNACKRGIEKQMGWKPSCKTNSAKWSYDGACTDHYIFGKMMGLDGPPTWKMKKIPKKDFENLMGEIHASVRYAGLHITSNEVIVRWSPESGEFKFSGTYGLGY